MLSLLDATTSSTPTCGCDDSMNDVKGMDDVSLNDTKNSKLSFATIGELR
jgi:hypothetical protein